VEDTPGVPAPASATSPGHLVKHAVAPSLVPLLVPLFSVLIVLVISR